MKNEREGKDGRMEGRKKGSEGSLTPEWICQCQPLPRD